MVTLGARGRHSSWPLSWLVRTRLARSEGLPRRLRASSARGPISAAPWNQPTTWWQASNSEASSIRSCSWSHGALLPQRDCVQGQPEPQRQLLRGQAGPLADLADRSSDGLVAERSQPAEHPDCIGRVAVRDAGGYLHVSLRHGAQWPWARSSRRGATAPPTRTTTPIAAPTPVASCWLRAANGHGDDGEQHGRGDGVWAASPGSFPPWPGCCG